MALHSEIERRTNGGSYCLQSGKVEMFNKISQAGKYLGQAAKLMIGVPDYDNYVQHVRLTHPEQTPMTYEEFFRERQDARYGGKGGFKCC